MTIVADDLRFDPSRLEAAAEVPFAIVLDNRERGIPHNVSVYRDASAAEAIAVGEVVIGEAEVAVPVPALARGTYFLRCDVHRVEMTGSLVVD